MKYIIFVIFLSCNLYAQDSKDEELEELKKEVRRLKKEKRKRNFEKEVDRVGDRWFIEPFLNGEAGGIEQEFLVEGITITAEGDSSGAQLGLRSGYIWSNFFLGLQISGAGGSWENVVLSSGSILNDVYLDDYTYSRGEFGLVLGWRFGRVFRMWLESLAVVTESESVSGDKTEYKGTKGMLGFGWNLVKGFSINAGIGGAIYDEEDGKKYPYSEDVDGTLVTANESSEYFISLGLSFAFGLYN